MEIWQAGEMHVKEIVELWKDLMDYHRQMDPFFTRREDGHLQFENFVRWLLTREENLVLAAVEEGKVVGYSIARIEEYPPIFIEEKFAHLYDMAVHPSFRHKGIGEAMLEEIEKWSRAKGMIRIELRVHPANSIGTAFWKKMGFETALLVQSKML